MFPILMVAAVLLAKIALPANLELLVRIALTAKKANV